MTDYLTLLAQAFCAQRRGHLGTGIMPVHTAIRDALDATGKLPRKADECTDDEVREAFGVIEFPKFVPGLKALYERGKEIVNLPPGSEHPVHPYHLMTRQDFEVADEPEGMDYLTDLHTDKPAETPAEPTAATDEDVQAFTDQINDKPKWKGGK